MLFRFTAQKMSHSCWKISYYCINDFYRIEQQQSDTLFLLLLRVSCCNFHVIRQCQGGTIRESFVHCRCQTKRGERVCGTRLLEANGFDGGLIT